MSEKLINCIVPKSHDLLLEFKKEVKACEEEIYRLSIKLGIDPQEEGLNLEELRTLNYIREEGKQHSSTKAISPRNAAQIASGGRV